MSLPSNESNDARGPNVPSDRSAAVARIAELLDDPAMREQLADLLAEAVVAAPAPWWRRMGPRIASGSSALVVLLAFLIPGLQDQWDRIQSRAVVNHYVSMGRSLATAHCYRTAEEVFARAFELSEGKRVDIERERLDARVHQLAQLPAWGVANPDSLREGDFLWLLQLQRSSGDRAGEVAALTIYADFLAGAHRYADGERAARAAVMLDPRAPRSHVALGNVLSEVGRNRAAEQSYREALRLAPDDASAHYDLGLLLAASGRDSEAEQSFVAAARHAPSDPLVLAELAEQLQRNDKGAAAALVRRRLQSQDSGSDPLGVQRGADSLLAGFPPCERS